MSKLKDLANNYGASGGAGGGGGGGGGGGATFG